MKRLLYLFFLFFVLFQTNSRGANEEPTKAITILVPESLSSLPFFIIAEKQPLSDITIKVETFTQHAQALIKLIRDEADFLFTGTTQGWQSYWDGNQLVALNTYVWGISSLIVKDQSLNSINDLIGKKIALPFPNSPLDLKTKKILATYNLYNPSLIQFEYRPFSQSIPLLVSGQIDAVALPEPQATQMVINYKLKRLFEYQKVWADITGDKKNNGFSPEVTLYTTKTKITSLKTLFKNLNSKISLILKEMPSNYSSLAAKYSKRFGLTPEIFLEALKKTSFWGPNFKVHKEECLRYLEQIRPFFSTAAGNLKNDFFFE